MWYWYHYFVIDFKVDYYRNPLQNCFKTSKQVLWQYSRVLHLQANTFSSIGTILLSITTILTGTVTMLVSFVQVNTPVVTSKCNNHEYCQNTCKFWSKTYKNCDNTWELCTCKYLVLLMSITKIHTSIEQVNTSEIFHFSQCDLFIIN